MARISMRSNRKFMRLCRDIQRPPYQVRGLLEMMWESAHENEPTFPTLDDAEVVSTWDGEAGVFGKALLACGFLDAVEGGFFVHDYWQHAPGWVREREKKRRQRGVSGTDRGRSGDKMGTEWGQDGDVSSHGAPSVAKPSVAKSREEKKPSAHPGFEEFWEAYPKKRNKGDAEKAWKKLNPPLAVILDALDWQREQPSWTKDGGQFVPYPASYLNAKGWEDEPVAPPEPFDPFAGVTRPVTEEEADWMMGLTDVKPKSLGG